MVLKSEIIKSKLTNFFNIVLVLLIIYLCVNFFYLIWYIADPEGFWGLNYFWELIFVGLTIIIILTTAIVMIFSFIASFYKFCTGKSTFKELIKIVGIAIVAILLTGFNFLSERGFSIYLSKKLSDKYSYLNKTESYLQEGDKVTAFTYSNKLYRKAIENKTISNFFIFAKIYSNTDFDKRQKLMKRYAALINYGYCLKYEPKKIDKSEIIFLNTLNLIDNDLLKGDKNNLAIFPTLSLAEIYFQTGKYEKADLYFNKLSELNRSSSKEDIIYLLENNMLFADYAFRVGDVDKAMQIQLTNLNLYEEHDLSKTSSNYLAILLTAITSQLYNQNYEQAAELLIKAIPIAEKKSHKEIYINFLQVKSNYCLMSALAGRGNKDVIQKDWFDNLKNVFSKRQDLKTELLEEAENSLLELLQISKEKQGESSFEFVNYLVQLANFYNQTGNDNEAKVTYQKALAIIKPDKDKNENLYYNILLNAISIGLIDQISIRELEEYYYKTLDDNFLFLTEEEKITYSINFERKISLINSYHIKKNDLNSGVNLFNNTLALKNIALYSNQNTRNFLTQCDDKIKSEYFNILAKKADSQNRKISKQDSDKFVDIEQRKLISTITKNKNFAAIKSRNISWIDIKNKLQTNEIAIEIINVPVNINGKIEKVYYALIIDSNSNAPEVVRLFVEKDLLRLLDQKGNVKQKVSNIYELNKLKLGNLIWDKIEQKAQRKDRIYLSVSGILQTISFPALLVDKEIEVIHLGSTREILNRTSKKDTSNNMILFGGIDYGVNNATAKQNERNKNKSLNTPYKYLPYTKTEIDQIRSLFETKSTNEAGFFSDKLASEQSFRSLEGKDVDIIHIATHGFYHKYGNVQNDLTNSVNENVLLQSGLLFSGANINTDNNSRNDGVLNSFEISQMNLSGVNLVVLSACETGLGKFYGSEGVFGLQRAFKLAGADAVIVSLWQVPDQSTSELMIQFYKYYFKGYSKNYSLLNAQKDIRKRYNNPYYWAGFKLVE